MAKFQLLLPILLQGFAVLFIEFGVTGKRVKWTLEKLTMSEFETLKEMHEEATSPQVDYDIYQKRQVYETELQPLLTRLDEIIRLLKWILEKV